jgi:hypothetical protein
MLDVSVHGVLPGGLGVVDELGTFGLDSLVGFACGDDGIVDGFLSVLVSDGLSDTILDGLKHGILLVMGYPRNVIVSLWVTLLYPTNHFPQKQHI